MNLKEKYDRIDPKCDDPDKSGLVCKVVKGTTNLKLTLKALDPGEKPPEKQPEKSPEKQPEKQQADKESSKKEQPDKQ
jgi:hypothetical protein